MRRGRPSDNYPQQEFRTLVLGTIGERGLSLRVLEALSGVNRGTLSGVLHGIRPCETKDRAAIMRALGFGPEVQAQFLPSTTDQASEHDLILLDGRISSHPQLHRAQSLMSRGQFAEAHQEFIAVFEIGSAQGDLLLQADAAAWLAWYHGELERFKESLRWTDVSIRLIESRFRMATKEIIQSINVSRPLTGASSEAAHVLSRALRIRSKILAVRIVHHMEFGWLPEATRAFEQSLELDERLQLTELAHNLRWRAVALSAEDGSQIKDVEDLLSASRERLPIGSPGEACLIREQGIIRWQKNRLATATRFLRDARERLASFADARALGPTFCVLSKITIQDGGDIEEARRYALIAGCLHPYGYVLEHAVDQLRKAPAIDRERDFEDLQTGRKPFDVIHSVMKRVALGSPHTALRLIDRNLARVRMALRIEVAGTFTKSTHWNG